MRYAIFKYIPSILRMEPRNIGLLLWNENRYFLKFLGEGDSLFPSFVNDKDVYRQWLDYWHDRISEKWPNDHANLLNYLNKSKGYQGSYFVVDGGVVFDDGSEDEFEKIGLDLFRNLIDETEPKKESYQGRAAEFAGKGSAIGFKCGGCKEDLSG